MNTKFQNWSGLLQSKEGRIFVVGVVVAILYIIWLGSNILFNSDISQVTIGMTATHILFGRAAGMSFGYSLGLGHKLVISIAMIIETILVLIFYPLFVFSWQHLIEIKFLQKFMDRSRDMARKNQEKIMKCGIIGLFVFVWFPFWMTGPLIGCIIGYFLGLRPLINISVILAGTYIAIFSWAVFLKELHERISTFSPYAPMILLLIIIIIAAIGHIMQAKKVKSYDKQE